MNTYLVVSAVLLVVVTSTPISEPSNVRDVHSNTNQHANQIIDARSLLLPIYNIQDQEHINVAPLPNAVKSSVPKPVDHIAQAVHDQYVLVRHADDFSDEDFTVRRAVEHINVTPRRYAVKPSVPKPVDHVAQAVHDQYVLVRHADDFSDEDFSDEDFTVRRAVEHINVTPRRYAVKPSVLKPVDNVAQEVYVRHASARNYDDLSDEDFSIWRAIERTDISPLPNAVKQSVPKQVDHIAQAVHDQYVLVRHTDDFSDEDFSGEDFSGEDFTVRRAVEHINVLQLIVDHAKPVDHVAQAVHNQYVLVRHADDFSDEDFTFRRDVEHINITPLRYAVKQSVSKPVDHVAQEVYVQHASARNYDDLSDEDFSIWRVVERTDITPLTHAMEPLVPKPVDQISPAVHH